MLLKSASGKVKRQKGQSSGMMGHLKNLDLAKRGDSFVVGYLSSCGNEEKSASMRVLFPKGMKKSSGSLIQP